MGIMKREIERQAERNSYYVCMIEYPARFNKSTNERQPAERQAIVDPEITRREVISRIASGEYPHETISFIHHVADGRVEDVTIELMEDALRKLQAAE